MKSINTPWRVALFAAAIGLATTVVHAQEDSALLDMLVQKKLLTQKDADQVRQDMEQQSVPAPATKWSISSPVSEIDLFGELRLRYFHNDIDVVGNDHGEQDRFRYRLRLGANIKLTDNFMIGVLLEGNNSSHSANDTFGSGNSTVSTPLTSTSATTSTSTIPGSITIPGGKTIVPTPGSSDAEVFDKAVANSGLAVTGVTFGTVSVTTGSGKTAKTTQTTVVTGVKYGSVVTSVNFQDTVFFGQVYAKYTPFPWAVLEAGKLPNPFITSRMVWDPDVYPEGIAEQFKFTLGPWGGKDPAASGKDGKNAVAPAPAREGVTVDLFGNFGQFIYEDVVQDNLNNAGLGTQTADKQDLWLLGWQLGAKANFTKDIYLQVAPTLYNYAGDGSIFGGTFNGDGPENLPQLLLDKNTDLARINFNTIAVNALCVVDIPVEFGWKMWNTPFKVFGEFADNTEGGSRAIQAGHPDKQNENQAYQVGASIGEMKKKGDFQVMGWWQHSEQFALDPNIIDDDIFDGRLNMEGFYLQASYMFTDAFSIIIQGSHARRIDQTIGTAGQGAEGDPAGLPLQYATHFYVDFSLKF